MSNLNKEPAYVKRNRIKKEQKARYLKQQAEKLRLKKIADAKRISDKVTVTKKNNETTTSRERGPKVIVRQGTPDQKRGTKVQTATEKKTVKKTAEKKTVKKENKPQPPKMPQSIKDMRAKNDAKKDKKTGSKKTAASASNTKDFENTKRIQQRLKDLGADIKVDGIMGAKTRAAMAKDKAKPKKVSEMTTKEVKERGTYNLKTGGKGTYKQRQAEIQKEKSNKKMADRMLKTLKKKK